ncbi:MAG: FecR family protein [Campylobacter sp.]
MRKIFLLTTIFTFVFSSVGSLTLVDGDVDILRDGKSVKAKENDDILSLDVIKTGKNSKAKITFSDQTIITIGKESLINIEEYIYNDNEVKFQTNVIKGAFHAISGKIGKINPDKFKLKTKTASIGIRGTEFLGNSDTIACTKGEIIIFSGGTFVSVKQGEMIKTFINNVPSQPIKLDQKSMENMAKDIGLDSKDFSNENLNFQTNQTQTTSQPEQTNITVKSQNLAKTDENQVQNSSNLEANSRQNIVIDNENSWGYWSNSANNQSALNDKSSQMTNVANEIKTISDKANEQNLLEKIDPEPRVRPMPNFPSGINYLQKLEILANAEPDKKLRLSGAFKGGYVDLTISFDKNHNAIVKGTYALSLANTKAMSGEFDGNLVLNGDRGQIKVENSGGINLLSGNLHKDIDKGVVRADRGYTNFQIDAQLAFDSDKKTTPVKMVLRETTNTLRELIQRLISDPIHFNPNEPNYADNMLANQLNFDGKINSNNDSSSINFKFELINNKTEVSGTYSFELNGKTYTENFTSQNITNTGFKITTQNNTQIEGKFIGNKRHIDGVKGTIKTTDNAVASFSTVTPVQEYIRKLIDNTNVTQLEFASPINNIKENGSDVTNWQGSNIKFKIDFGKEFATIKDGNLNMSYTNQNGIQRNISQNFSGGFVGIKGLEISGRGTTIKGDFIGTENSVDRVKGSVETTVDTDKATGNFDAPRRN